MQQLQDSLWLPDFLRSREEYLTSPDPVSGLVKKLNDRDLTSTLLQIGVCISIGSLHTEWVDHGKIRLFEWEF